MLLYNLCGRTTKQLLLKESASINFFVLMDDPPGYFDSLHNRKLKYKIDSPILAIAPPNNGKSRFNEPKTEKNAYLSSETAHL